MSKEIKQIYDSNPSTTVADTSLIYLGLSPYSSTDDSAIIYSDFFSQIETSIEDSTEFIISSVTSSINPTGLSMGNLIEGSINCSIEGDNTYRSSIISGSDCTIGSTGAFVLEAIVSGENNEVGTSGAGNINSVFVGGRFNSINGSLDTSAIITGTSNSITGTSGNGSCLIASGQDNVIDQGLQSIILGGSSNTINGSEQGCIVSGSNNTTDSDGAIVSGDTNTLTHVAQSFIGSGFQNSITGTGQGYSAILAGQQNSISSSQASSIVYGQLNTITAATSSFAGGTDSHVASGHQGSFIISDTTATAFTTDSSNQFKGFFSSGYRLLGGNNFSFSGTSNILDVNLQNNEIQFYVDSISADLVAKYKDNVGTTHSIDLSLGSGDVVGPSSSTDSAVCRYDGVTGKLIQDSTVLLTDLGSFDGVLSIIGRPGTITSTAKTISILPLDGALTGKGGEIDLIAGAGGPSGGNGGDIYLIAGGGTFTDTDAGNIYLQSNGGIGTGTNGTIFALLDISGDPVGQAPLNIFTPDPAAANGGNVNITAASPQSGSFNGGNLNLTAGTESGAGTEGQITLNSTTNMMTNILTGLPDAINPTDAVAYGQVSNLDEVTNSVKVSMITGSVSGDGSISNPFLSVLDAENSITTNAPGNNVVVQIESGTYAETSLPIKPFTSLLGDGFLATQLNINGGVGDITLSNADWTGVNGSFSMDGLQIVSGINLDFTAAAATSCFGTIQNCFISGDSNLLGVNGGNINLIFFNTSIESGTIVFDSLIGSCLNAVLSGPSVTIQTTVDNCSFTAQGAVIIGNLTLSSSGGFSSVSEITNSKLSGTLTIDGTNTTLSIDAASYKVPIFTGGATASQVTITNDSAGTYTPTLTNTTNISASTAYQCQFMRVGNVVTVSGRVDIDPILAGVDTVLILSLPISSTFAAAENCGGSAYCPGVAAQGAAMLAIPATSTIQMQWVSSDVTNQPMYFSATYLII